MVLKLLITWYLLLQLSFNHSVSGFTYQSIAVARPPCVWNGITFQHKANLGLSGQHDPSEELEERLSQQGEIPVTSISTPSTAAAISILSFIPAFPANAIVTDVIPNALVAYSHYLFILIVMGILVYERITVEAGMSKETEKSLVIADAAYGAAALVLFITGYFRAVDYGKGWDFYSHEPIFWLKFASASLLAGLSAFPTITLIKRGIPIFRGEDVEPMSEKLAKRMKQVINAEISAILFIPLLATLMARGVSYSNDFPWPAGAAFATIVFLGSGFFYAKQALSWNDDVSTESD